MTRPSLMYGGMMDQIHRGLVGVKIDTSGICHIDGLKGELIYRGYDIRDLAAGATFEEVVYLLWYGDLPDQQQLAAFRERLNAQLELPAEAELLKWGGDGIRPMHALRTAVSAMGSADLAADGLDQDNLERIGLRLTAQIPALVAAIVRFRNGEQLVQPKPELSLAANFLYMLTGEEPTDAAVRVMDVALILHAEHGVNASTFAARAIAGTNSDAYSAITAAIGSLKGPSHGGANTAVMETLESLGSVEDVEPYVLDILGRPKGRVMGFGHRVYRVLDPRATVLKRVAQELAAERADSAASRYFEMSLEMERVMDREMEKRGREVKANVDFFSASVYHMLGFPTDLFTPIFAAARTPGWLAHLYEQYADNVLLRPQLVYDGPLDRKFVPLAGR